MMSRVRLMIWLTWGVCLGMVAGCATSGTSQTSRPSSSPETANERASSPQKPPRVALHSLLGRTLSDGPPEGCRSSWETVETQESDKSSIFCFKFRAEHWQEEPLPVTLIMSSSEKKVEVVSIQQSFDEVSRAEGQFNKVSGSLLDRCQRKTGGFRYLVADCDDYIVEVDWNNQYAQSRFIMRYAETYERLGGNKP